MIVDVGYTLNCLSIDMNSSNKNVKTVLIVCEFRWLTIMIEKEVKLTWILKCCECNFN